MTEHYQVRIAGDPDWTPGRENFTTVFGNARDQLRFHRGAGWRLQVNQETPGPVIRLSEVEDRVKSVLTSHPIDTSVRIASVEDGYSLLMRRHKVTDALGQQVVAAAAALKNTSYVFGQTDCSWLSGTCVEQVSGIVLPHHAASQKTDPHVTLISRDKLIPGDLIFIRDEHVAIWKGADAHYPGGPVVWDTEPSNTVSPSGWPTAMLGTGVQVRPAFGGWYCAAFDASGRIPAINGRPS